MARFAVKARRRIAIATNGRFHVLDLARELDALGHEVRFYSWLPRARAIAFGLPIKAHVNLFPRLAAIAAWQNYFPRVAPELTNRIALSSLNSAIIDQLMPCDDFIGMSGVVLEAAQFAKQRFGARVWMERGSQHILAQRDLLASLPGAQLPSKIDVIRELESYALADRISVPATHVVRSFAVDRSSREKLFLNPYGVAVEKFDAKSRKRAVGPQTILMVGGWSLRKGVDLLAKAVEAVPGVNLLHVGAIVDAKFPKHPRFEHHDAVDQSRLPEFYSRGDVFALASREEGLALVQAQALASGLPLVCSDRTGGSDLGFTAELRNRIFEVPHGAFEPLAERLAAVLKRVSSSDFLPLSDTSLEALSWRSYGERYSRALDNDSNLRGRN